jgi:hypothetical protein
LPTVLKSGPYRLFFYSGDRDEPIHIHVERDLMVAKFWVEPVRLQENDGFSRSELIKIQKIVERNSKKIIEAWDEYFKN